MSRWIAVERRWIPEGPGVYVVYQDNRVVYVGSSTRLQARVRRYFNKERWPFDLRHIAPAERYNTPWNFYHAGDRIRVKVKYSRRLGDWLMWEWRLIHRLQPEFNKAGIRAAERAAANQAGVLTTQES
jgi:hypothetical protein